MRKTHRSVFFIIIVLVIAISYIAVFGVYSVYGEITTTIVKGVKDLNYDKSIGYSATVGYTAPEGTTPEQLDSAKLALGNRLQYYGYTDFEIYEDYSAAKLLVSLPWASYAQTSVDTLAATLNLQGVFEVRLGREVDDDGNPTGETLSTVLFSNEIVKDMEIDTSMYYFYNLSSVINLTRAGSRAFNAKIAEMLAETPDGASVSFWMDGEFWGSRTFTEVPTDSSIKIISAAESSTEMNSTYALLVNRQAALTSGVIPLKLTVGGTAQYIPATANNFNTLLYVVGGISVLAALLFVIVYKLPGLCAALMIILQTGLGAAVFSGVFSDVNTTSVTFGNLAAYFAGFLMVAVGSAFICSRIARYTSEGLSSAKAVQTAFDKHGAKILLSYGVVFVMALVLNIIAAIPALGAGKVFSLSAISSFSALLMIFAAIAAAELLLFVVAARSLADESTRLNSAFSSFAFSAGKDKSKPSKAFVVALVAVLAIVLGSGAAAYIASPVYSAQYNGLLQVTKSFSDGELKTDELLASVNALADNVNSRYEYSSSGTKYALTVTAPLESALTEEQVTQLLTETDAEAFAAVISGSFARSMGMTDFAVLAAWLAVAVIIAALFTAIFSSHVKKFSAFMSVLLSGILCTCATFFVMLVCGVAINHTMIALCAAACTAAVFVSSWCVFTADSEKPRHKRESAQQCAKLVYNNSISGAVSLFACIALTLAAAVVLCVIAAQAAITGFAVGLLVCALCGCVAPYFIASFGVCR